MKVRIPIIVACEAAGCTRQTEATARVSFFLTLLFNDVRFSPGPLGEETGWTCTDDRVRCPEHPLLDVSHGENASVKP